MLHLGGEVRLGEALLRLGEALLRLGEALLRLSGLEISETQASGSPRRGFLHLGKRSYS